MSDFQKFKSNGNKFYKKCKFTEALLNYREAEKHAKSDDEKASIYKNLGTTNSKKLDKVKVENTEVHIFHTIEALKMYNAAMKYAEGKSIDWKNMIQDQAKMLAINLIDKVSEYTRDMRIDLCYKIRNQCLELELAKLVTSFKLAELLFYEGVEHTEKKEFIKALDCFENFNEPSIITKSLAKKYKKKDIEEEIDDLTERCLLHLYRAKAMREKYIGNKILEDVLHGDDVLCVELVWDAIDHFIHAITICRGQDTELEAELCSQIGEAFDILTLEDRSIKFYEASIALAITLVPRVMTTVSWYKKANYFLRKVQIKRSMKEDQDRDEMIGKYKDELKSEFDELRLKSSLNAKEFLKYLYERFPPKNLKGVKFDSSKDIKKQLQIALIHYHPDKNQLENGKWIVLCHEITTYLTRYYSPYSCN